MTIIHLAMAATGGKLRFMRLSLSQHDRPLKLLPDPPPPRSKGQRPPWELLRGQLLPGQQPSLPPRL